MMTANVTLRPYQIDMVTAAERDLTSHRSAVVVSATGTGKTSVGAAVVSRALAAGARHVLVYAHRRELLDQLEARMQLFGLTTTRDLAAWASAQVTIASVQTLVRRLVTIPASAFDLVLADECHHCPSASNRAVLAHFSHARLLGLTATPDRADGVSLGTVFETCSSRYDIDRAVAEGYLVPVRALRVEVPGMDLSKVRSRTRATSAGSEFTDLHPGDLGKAAIAPEAVEGVVGPLLQLADDRRTVVFAVDCAHAAALAAAINARRPGAARAVDGSMRARDRAEVLAAHQAGAYQFLCNVLVLAEGYDDPGIACVAIARPTQSRVLFVQTTGRALRLCAGKSFALLLDFVGVACQHDLVGPDDVLAGALIEPSRTVGRLSKRAARRVLAGYAPQSWPVRFATTVVDVMRRGAKRGARASAKGARTVGGWIKSVLFG